MIRSFINAEKISESVLKISGQKIKQLNLCINYEKGSEKGIEIEFQLKFYAIPGHFRLYKKDENEIFKVIMKDPDSRIIPMDLPICEEILINISYIGEFDDKSFVDIYPIYYKI